jgi:hypothetical protein
MLNFTTVFENWVSEIRKESGDFASALKDKAFREKNLPVWALSTANKEQSSRSGISATEIARGCR